MKTKAKTVSLVVGTREEMAVVAAEIARAQIDLTVLKGELAAEVEAVQARYSERIEALEANVEEKMQAALDWCVRNEAAEFVQARSIDFVQTTVEFKKNPPKVLLKHGWKMEKVIASLKAFLAPGKPPGTNYIRTVDELNRETILQDREKFTAEEWGAVGVKIGQEKSLTITPKAGAVESARLAA